MQAKFHVLHFGEQLTFLLSALILCVMFSREFFSSFFSFFMLLHAVFMYVVYIYIFLSLPYGE